MLPLDPNFLLASCTLAIKDDFLDPSLLEEEVFRDPSMEEEETFREGAERRLIDPFEHST